MRGLAAAVALCLGAGGAWAGVENTHHDMRIYNLFEEQSVCAYCHVPHAALSQEKLFARTSAAEGLGPIGVFCYSCHDGTVIPTALVEAPDGTVGLEALTRSHGYEIQKIETATLGLEKSEFVFSSGLVPIKDPTNTPRTLDCDACHDPHSDQYPPFLRVSLGELCQKCHRGSDGQGKGRWTTVEETGALNQSHPVGMPLAESGKDRVRALPSEYSFTGPDAVLSAPTPTSAELANASVHWQTGGHLLGVERIVGCNTCHSAHVPKPDLLVAHASRAASYDKTVCAGCHRKGDNRENPGATDYYHPVFESATPPYVHDHASHGLVEANPNLPATGTFELFVTLPREWPLSPKGELLCLTCHRAHQGVAGGRCLRAGPKGAKVQCNECHGTGDQPQVANIHHPVSEKDYTQAESGRFEKLTGWAWGPGLPGDLSDGLQCVDCHSEAAKGGHNWQ